MAILLQSKSLLEQKDQYLTHASERIITLEKRLKGAHLSGDDQVKALEAEVLTTFAIGEFSLGRVIIIVIIRVTT